MLFNETLEEKDLLLPANKLIEQIPDLLNTKEYYQSFIRKKHKRRQSEIITFQLNTFQNLNIVNIKITKHPQTSHKLSKTMRENEKVRSNSSLYSSTRKRKKFLNEINVKITKRPHAFKGFASSDNVKILSYFNPELQLKDIEFEIKSKLIDY